jgi:hypothetical protein
MSTNKKTNAHQSKKAQGKHTRQQWKQVLVEREREAKNCSKMWCEFLLQLCLIADGPLGVDLLVDGVLEPRFGR